VKSYISMLRTCLRLFSAVLIVVALANLAGYLILPRLFGSSASSVALLSSVLVLTTAQLLIVICAYLKMAGEIRHALQQEQQLRQNEEHLLEEQRRQEQLLLMLNHEVRTPLSSIKGFADLIRCYGDHLGKELLDRYLMEIGSACDEATFILDSIVYAKRDHEEADQRRSLDIKEAILSVVTSFAPRLQSEGRQIDLQLESALVTASPLPLRQVLRNLLNNALNYSPQGTGLQIRVTCRPEQDGREQVYIAIKDEGIGISPEDQAQLFQPFHRLERAQQLAPYGKGLGLYLSKQLLEEMGGRLWLESEGRPGAGTQVWISLPRA
jgi:two-component system sensor histidine kinase SaeS